MASKWTYSKIIQPVKCLHIYFYYLLCSRIRGVSFCSLMYYWAIIHSFNVATAEREATFPFFQAEAAPCYHPGTLYVAVQFTVSCVVLWQRCSDAAAAAVLYGPLSKTCKACSRRLEAWQHRFVSQEMLIPAPVRPFYSLFGFFFLTLAELFSLSLLLTG